MATKQKTKKVTTRGMFAPIKSYIGTIANAQLDGLTVQVRIKDYKESYGRKRFLVTPKSGTGEKWTEKVQVPKLAHN